MTKVSRRGVPTPSLLVDIDLLDANIAVMAARAKAMGVQLRPHAKAHKCVEIAQRLAERWLLYFGILFILIVFFFPRGVYGTLRHTRAPRRSRSD